MNKRKEYSTGIIKIIMSVVLLGVLGCDQQQELEIIVSNTINQERPDAQVVISHDSLSKKSQLIEGAFNLYNSDEEAIPFQLDDMDGDGVWDELAFTCSLSANSSETFYIKEPTEDSTSFKNRTQVWLAKRDSASGTYKELTKEVRPDWYEGTSSPPYYYQFEGPGWENDKVGFRMYFDERNGFDIWGKKTADMVLQKVGIEDDYHAMSEWGMDILYVGNSLGAGSIGAKAGQQFYRLNGTDHEQFLKVTDGPVRAVFDLTYKGWKVDNKDYSIRERISIWAGADGFQNEIRMLNSEIPLRVIAGFVTSRYTGEMDFVSESPSPYIMSYGHQSENDGKLGMAIIPRSNEFITHGSIMNSDGPIDSTAYVELELTKDNSVMYHFTTGWETGNKKFNDEQGFKEAVIDVGRRMNNPVKIEIL